jgi:hypothetical protein
MTRFYEAMQRQKTSQNASAIQVSNIIRINEKEQTRK